MAAKKKAAPKKKVAVAPVVVPVNPNTEQTVRLAMLERFSPVPEEGKSAALKKTLECKVPQNEAFNPATWGTLVTEGEVHAAISGLCVRFGLRLSSIELASSLFGPPVDGHYFAYYKFEGLYAGS